MKNNGNDHITQKADEIADADRRQFLSAVGKFSVVTPPTIALLLSTSLTSQAIAMSGGKESRGSDRGDRGEHRHGERDWGL